jgi:hypothetical protein
MDNTQLTISVLMYFVLPVWLAASGARRAQMTANRNMLMTAQF